MISRILGAMAAIFLLLASNTSVAQSPPVEVTFQVPLNLTELSADITRVRVTCMIEKDEQLGATRTYEQFAATNSQEFPVSAGQLIMTASVVVSVDATRVAAGETARYGCFLYGYSSPLQRWYDFSEAQDTGIAGFQLTPRTSPIAGNFVW